MTLRTYDKRGFTLVEIIVVVAIVGILTALVVASFISAQRVGRKNACITNLKQIQTVINTWALDTGATSDDFISKTDLVPDYFKSWPKEGTSDYPVPVNITEKPVCPNLADNPDHTI